MLYLCVYNPLILQQNHKGSLIPNIRIDVQKGDKFCRLVVTAETSGKICRVTRDGNT